MKVGQAPERLSGWGPFTVPPMSQQVGQLLPVPAPTPPGLSSLGLRPSTWAQGAAERCLSYDSRMPHLAGIFQISLQKLFMVRDPGHCRAEKTTDL